MSEFMNDGQRDDYLAALEVEMAGYKAREAAGVAVGNKDLVAMMKSRQDQVQKEIDRVSQTVAGGGEETKPARRGRASSGEGDGSGDDAS